MKNFILAIVTALLFTSYTFGASFVVNNNGDTSDANTADNLCLDASGNCTLRAAIQQANASLSDDDVITFAPGLATITLTTNTEIPISNAGTLQINGPGANVLTIDGGTGSNRIFNLNSANVTITNVTLTGGGTSEFTGGLTAGGAINVIGGSLILLRVHIFANNAGSGSTVGTPGSGGGVYYSGGTHSISNSTFSNNFASGGSGGGVRILADTDVTITNSTFSGNAGTASGGGISNSGTLRLRNVTVAGNTAYKGPGIFGTGYGGGIANSGNLEINNTIVAGNAVTFGGGSPIGSPEIYFAGGTITSTGNNIVGDSTGDSTNTGNPIAYQPSDIRDIPTQLAALAYNGGTTPTRALLANSPAINAGNNTNAPPTDQRGAPRVGAVDIGAYEFGGLLFSISGRVTSDGTTGLSGVTVTLSGSSSATTTTNANGEYTFAGLVEGGNYTVTPTQSGITFDPLSASFTNLNSNQTANFRPQCVYSINPTSVNVSSASNSGSVTVTASAGCSWTAVSNSPFISVAPGSGTGSGTVNYTVQANPTAVVRTGTITIAGQTFTVTQAALESLSINNVSQFEGNAGTTNFTFTVTLSSASSQTVTVSYATVNGTATPPSDYQGTAGTLTFAPGETTKTITIQVVGDTVNEATETFTVNLSGASNAVIINGQGTGTIQNDDGPGARLSYDFDGDGRADIVVFRPSNGYWYILRSADATFQALPFGQQNDRIAPADYDGDRKTDVAVFRDSTPGAGNFAYFYISNSTDGSFRYEQFGVTGDMPMVGDWDADGKADLAVYRDGSLTGGQSYFYYRPSSAPSVNFREIAWGAAGDKPVMGDFDGDGRLDAAVFRPSVAMWYIQRSSDGQTTGVQFGASTDVPITADLDGDGRANIAVFRPSNGTWYTSTNPQLNYGAVLFGAAGDLPIPADYDGDGKADIAVFRPSNGVWYMLRSTQGFTGTAFGVSEDKPIPNAYIR